MEREGNRIRQRPYQIVHLSYEEVIQRPDFRSKSLQRQDEIITEEVLMPARAERRARTSVQRQD